MSTKQRIAWLLITVLFVVTGLGVGVYAFWANTHPPKPEDSYIKCQKGAKAPNQQPLDGKVEGAKLADFNPPKKASYLTCIDYVVGTGATVTSAQATVTVQYVGALASNGVIFDSSFDTGQPLTIQLIQVIKGWGEGLLGMKVGGMRRLFIPAQYGYGQQALQGIPANSDLVFDVRLVNVK